MGRPKRPRKLGRRAVARRRREELGATPASRSNELVFFNGSSTITWTPLYAITLPDRRSITIESLDGGATWHAADTFEPAANINGSLVIGSAPCGAAPECMRPGSGTYSFEIEHRWATDEEVDAWMRDKEQRDREYVEQYRRECRERSEKEARIRARARQLLMSHLSPSQQRDFEELDGFWVTSQFGNLYWVTPRTAVRFDKDGRALQHYCIHAEDAEVPPEDNALARMLVLKCDEEMFLRTANPGLPSDWDFSPVRSTAVVLDAPLDAQPLTVNGGFEMTTTASSSSRVEVNMGDAMNDFVAVPATESGVTLPGQPFMSVRPIMLYVNGVVRPIYG